MSVEELALLVAACPVFKLADLDVLDFGGGAV